MRKFSIWFIGIIFVIVTIVAVYVGPRLPVITGYGAKYLCSAVFLSDRSEADVLAEDLAYGYFKYVTYKVDFNEKSVTATLLGLAKQKALFLGGTGCSLMLNVPEDSLRSFPASCETCSRQTTASRMWPVCGKNVEIPLIDQEKLTAAVAAGFDEPGENSRAVVVLYDTVLIAEKYAPGFTRETRILGWSMSKSVTNALAGIMIKSKKFSLNDPVKINEWQIDDRRKITLNNLLQMNSGLEWDENYNDLSDVTCMLYKTDDMYGYAIKKPLARQPGEYWQYSSGTANIVAGYLKNYFKTRQTYVCFPKKSLFNLIGMNSAVFETDASGKFVGSSYVHATALDWARFGLLYLKDGVWQNRRILPEGWCEYTSTVAAGSEGKYGAHFWLNQAGTYPDIPRDMYYANGHHGQRVFIIPSRNMVIVRMGFNEETDFDFNDFVRGILAAVK